MAKSLGKKFEEKFREDFLKLDNSVCIRLPDQMNGYKKTSSNICDFICFKYPKLYLIECKEHKGNTFPLSELRQYDKLVSFIGKIGVHPGVVLWYSDHDKVYFVPIAVFKLLKFENKSSLNIKQIADYPEIIEIPSVKKRVFMDSDYQILFDI